MADAIVVNNDKVTVRRSDGTKFLANESWTGWPYYGSIGTYVADVTGDGMADAIVVNNDKVTVRRSDGARFLPNESWTSEPYYGNYVLCQDQVVTPPKDQQPKPPGVVTPPPPPTGILIGSYIFDAQRGGTGPFDLTVDFTGRLDSPLDLNGQGQTTFTVQSTGHLFSAPNQSVGFATTGLRKGTWVVTAYPRGVGAPWTCKATVSGFVHLDVSGGNGPHCW